MSPAGKYLFVLLISVAISVSYSQKILQFGVNGPSDRKVTEHSGIARDNTIFTEGLLRPTDELYFDYEESCVGIADDVVSHFVTFIHIAGNFTYVEVLENGESKNATASIVEGGLSCWYLTVNIISDISSGYDVTVNVFGSEYYRRDVTTEMSYEEFVRMKKELECEDVNGPPTDAPTEPTSATDAE